MVQASEMDSITASVLQGALENIAVEMGYKLMRMSYSSIIRESEDFGAALVDAEGRGLAESAQSTPLQSGPIPGYIRGILRALRERGDTVRPGDVITARSRLQDFNERQGRFGLMLYAFTENEWTNQDGAFVRRRISTSIRY